MTVYPNATLPDGTEVQVLSRFGDGHHIAIDTRRAYVRHPVLGVISITEDHLTEIGPPLQWEPPSGGAAASTYTVWAHAHGGWFDVFDGASEPKLYGWAELNQMHPEIRPLVLDPAANAPELPYKNGGMRVNQRGSLVGVLVHEEYEGGEETMVPEDARQLAYAILRAAREAGQQ